MEAFLFAALVAWLVTRKGLADIPFMVRGKTPPSHERRMAEMRRREAARDRRHQRRLAKVARPRGAARSYASALWQHSWQQAAQRRRVKWEHRDPVKADAYARKIQAKLDGTLRGPVRRTIDRGRDLHAKARRAAEVRETPPDLNSPSPSSGTPDPSAAAEPDPRGEAAAEAPTGPACEACGQPGSDQDPLGMYETDTGRGAARIHRRHTTDGGGFQGARERRTDGSEQLPWLCREPGCSGRVHGTGTYARDDGRVDVKGRCTDCGTESTVIEDPAREFATSGGALVSGEVHTNWDNLAAAAAKQNGWRDESTTPDGRDYVRDHDGTRLTVHKNADGTYDWTAETPEAGLSGFGGAQSLEDAFDLAEAEGREHAEKALLTPDGKRLCGWCDDPATHKQDMSKPDGRVAHTDYACPTHAAELDKLTGATFDDGDVVGPVTSIPDSTPERGTTMPALGSEAATLEDFQAALDGHMNAAAGGPGDLEQHKAAIDKHMQGVQAGSAALGGLAASAQQHGMQDVAAGIAQASEGYSALATQHQVIRQAYARAAEAHGMVHAGLQRARAALRPSENVAEAYAANRGAGNSAFLTNGAVK